MAVCCWCGASLVVNQVEQLRCWTCAVPACMVRQVGHALFVNYTAGEAKRLGLKGPGRYCWHVPLPSQCGPYEWRKSYPGYLLWGGRAGPGKSTGGRWWLYHRSLNVPGHEALLLRENWDQLKANHTVKMAQEVPLLGGRWLDTDRMAIFGKGSTQSIIYCGHMADMEAVERYLGIEYGAILGDEASRYPVNHEGVSVLAELSTRARKEYVDLEGRTVSPVFMPVTNPGGPSAAWLKDMHIDKAPDLEKFPALAPEFDEHGVQISGYDPARWQYLAASLKDNPYMRPDYAQTTLAVLSGVRYKQLAEGDWSAMVGQFFDEWSSKDHVVARGKLSPELRWYESIDWGYSSPGNVGWYAALPQGGYHKARELKYMAMTADELAREIKKIRRELGLKKVLYTVCDPSMEQKTGHGRGESYMETLRRHGIHAVKGDNDRRNGWARVHTLLRINPLTGEPWLTFEPDGCRYSIRTLPLQMSKKTDPEDIDTTGDDHAADETRYFAQSRPLDGTKGREGARFAEGSLGALKRLGQQVTGGVLSR